jgi:hypothetical protein
MPLDRDALNQWSTIGEYTANVREILSIRDSCSDVPRDRTRQLIDEGFTLSSRRLIWGSSSEECGSSSSRSAGCARQAIVRSTEIDSGGRLDEHSRFRSRGGRLPRH